MATATAAAAAASSSPNRRRRHHRRVAHVDLVRHGARGVVWRELRPSHAKLASILGAIPDVGLEGEVARGVAQPHAVHDGVLPGSRSDRIRLEVDRGDEDVRVDWRKRVPARVVIVIPAQQRQRLVSQSRSGEARRGVSLGEVRCVLCGS
jgi:hypothetical protein